MTLRLSIVNRNKVMNFIKSEKVYQHRRSKLGVTVAGAIRSRARRPRRRRRKFAVPLSSREPIASEPLG